MMDQRSDEMDSLLAMLGKAHQEGAFSGTATRYPWQSPEIGAQSSGRRRWAWAWMAAPLTAAAAVAVLFVGPNFFSRQATPVIVHNVHNQLSPQHPEMLAVATPSSAQALDCDFNGDGVVNGEDIQPMIDRLKKGGGASQIDVDRLTRCLLGG